MPWLAASYIWGLTTRPSGHEPKHCHCGCQAEALSCLPHMLYQGSAKTCICFAQKSKVLES